MRLIKFFVLILPMLFIAQLDFASALAIVCPGQSASLRWSSGNASTCRSNVSGTPTSNALLCDFNPTPNQIELKQGGITLTGGECTVTLSCTNSATPAVTREITDTLRVATGAALNTLQCCGRWGMAGKVWNDTQQTCVSPGDVVPQPPATILGSCRAG